MLMLQDYDHDYNSDCASDCCYQDHYSASKAN